MNTGKNNRRGFLTTLASAAAGGTLLNSTLGVSSARALDVNPLAERLENEYLLSEGLIYLNTGTLGPCRRATVLATNKAWEELESFPIKFYGKQALDAPEKTRTVAARFFGCNLDEILLTHSTTSGMNMIAQGLRLKVRDRILITNQEHAGGLFCWNYLEKYHGVVIDKVDISHQDSVESILKKLKDNLKKETKVISLSHVFSSTGMRLPVAEISSLARANGVLCVVDGAQAAGAIAVNVKQLGCHAYAAGGHKWLMGPKGTGFLYISKEAQEAVRPMQFEESYNTYSSSNGVVNRAAILG
ncbi:MAG: aminotransferase class V-fold PLP-dependent enzyme, partial [Cyclobacteriaceae bacterium]|nr:aminotransferase class V-fold PLP-dependent enzyme [Cyclobacteriaceae bacterium]